MTLGRFRFRTEHLAIAGSLALLMAAILVLGRRPAGPGSNPVGSHPGSSRFATPGGTKALYTLLRNLGYPVARHARRIELLPDGAALVLLLAPREPLDEGEVAWARRWVAGGGTLIWAPPPGDGGTAKPDADALPGAFGLKQVSHKVDTVFRAAASLGPLGADATQRYALVFKGGDRLASTSASSPARPLAADDRGWVAATVPVGKGRFIALADPGLIANGGLAGAEHAAFAVHLIALAAKNGRILFDEYHHGDRSGQSALAVVWDSPIGPALLLGLAALFSATMARGRRLGPPVELHAERRRRPAEYLEACARLCRSLRAGPAAMAMILAEFKQHLRRLSGASTPEGAGGLAGRAGLETGRLSRALARARALADAPQADDSEMLACARELEILRDALLAAEGAGRPSPHRTR